MTSLDIKGMIPKWIINYVGARKPADWIEALKAAALEYQCQHPNYKETLAKELDKYKRFDPSDYADSGKASQSVESQDPQEAASAPLAQVVVEL